MGLAALFVQRVFRVDGAAEFLRTQGLGLRAGQAVITGSYAGSFTLPLGQDIVIRYGELGELSVHFSSLGTGGPGEPQAQ